MVELEEGEVLRAKMTGREYTVQKVTDHRVSVTGLPPLPRDQLEKDIRDGKITKV